MYCLDNEQTHFKTNFTVHFINYILNNLNESGHINIAHINMDNLLLLPDRSLCIIVFSTLIRICAMA